MHEELNQLVRAQCCELHEAGTGAIAPAEVSEAVYMRIDPARLAPFIVQASCKNDLRRRAEGALRHIYEAEEERVENGQTDAFTGHLQTRYPCEREGVFCYVAPENMTDAEIDRNLARLKKEAESKLSHHDALEAYKLNRNSAP